MAHPRYNFQINRSTSLEEYDRLFEAHESFQDSQRANSIHRIPIGNDVEEAPDPYSRDLHNYDDHHKEAYYPHVHQPLKSTRLRRKGKFREVKYKKKYKSRPSQLFYPSLQGVQEQNSNSSSSASISTTASTSSDTSGVGFWIGATPNPATLNLNLGDDAVSTSSLSSQVETASGENTPAAIEVEDNPLVNIIPATPEGPLTPTNASQSGDSASTLLTDEAINNNAKPDNSIKPSSSNNLQQASGSSNQMLTTPVTFMVGGRGYDADSVDSKGSFESIPPISSSSQLVEDVSSSQARHQRQRSVSPVVKFVIGGDSTAVIAHGQGPPSDSGSGSQIIQSRPYPDSVQPLQSTPFTNAPSFKENVTFTLGSGSCGSLDSENILGPSTVTTCKPAKPGLLAVSKARAKTVSEAPAAQKIAAKQRSVSYDGSSDMTLIRCRGSDVELSTLPLKKVASITTEEEAACLNNMDLEDLASHRLEKHKGLTRHRIDRKSTHRFISVDTSNNIVKPTIDLTPHELFVELDELVTQQHDELWEWKEKARWIKFEEDVLDSADRWGRPHVASLSFHSLIELRRFLENGIISLDLDILDYVHLMQMVVSMFIDKGHLHPDQKEYVKDALLLRHSHLGAKSNNLIRSKSYSNLKGLDSMSRPSRYSHFFGSSKASQSLLDKKSKLEQINHTVSVDMSGPAESGLLLRRNSRSYAENLDGEKYNLELLKKIPEGSEVASVLVGTLKQLTKPCVILVRLSKGVVLEHVAEVPLPVRFLFVCIGPPLESVEYLEIGRSLATLMSNKSFRETAYTARTKGHIMTAMNAFLDDSIVLPPGDFDKKTLLPIMHMAKKKLQQKKKRDEQLQKEMEMADGEKKPPLDDPLSRTGRPFGGLIKDIRRKAPRYLSDIKDGLNIQVISAFIFIYFACLSPAITFGGLLGEKTDNYMGASEMLFATGMSGVIFSLTSGQPLLITGFTGPNMVFEEGVYKFSENFGIDFLSWRLWIGVWIFVFSVVLVATEAMFLVKFVTRFTEEIFAFLISLIFIYEVFVKLFKVFKDHPLCADYSLCGTASLYTTLSTPLNASQGNTTSDLITYNIDYNYSSSGYTLVDLMTSPTTVLLSTKPNTALLTLTLTLSTFVIAYSLKGLRNRKVLGRTIRRALGDFGVPIAIAFMCLVDYVIGDSVYVPKLDVPSKFSVTDPSKRGWFISPLGSDGRFPVMHVFSAILPAILASILIFMESLIAGMIVNKKENKLAKGSGYNLDILSLGFVALINGLLGLPFVCAATVRSVAHLSALAVISTNHAPGESPKLEKVVEQRVSNFLVHLLIVSSMFLGMVLQHIPTAVLFGIFLYMGIASLGGIQLFDRIMLLITPKKHHPVELGYVRFVRAFRMNIFTLIQIVCVALLWAVKLSPGALAFPFVLLLLVPFRLFVLNRIFTHEELERLDGEDDCKVLLSRDQIDEEPDFYETAHMPD